MADIKISELPAADPLDGTEQFPVVQAGETRRATVDNATLRPIEAGDSLTSHEGDRVAVSGLSNHTIFDLAEATDLLGGVIFGGSIGVRLTVDGSVVWDRTGTSIAARDLGDTIYGVIVVPFARGYNSMKLEVRNFSGSARDTGWRVVTR